MAKKNPKSQKKIKRSLLGGVMKFCMAMVVLALVCGVVFCGFYFVRAMAFDMDEVQDMPERTVVLDRNGLEIGKIHGENRTVVGINEISDNFLMSIIAREDARFYEHIGIDLRGLARAFVRNVKDRNMTQGASTIPMQLARNTFDLSEGDEWYHELDRKFLEVFVALRINLKYEKTEILEHYSNRIFWGHSMLGIESASQAYLQKPAQELTLSEGAMLAGIVRGPNAFSPFRSIKLATRERDTVLDRLVYYQYITPDQAAEAKAEPLRIRPKKSRTRGQSYAMEMISRELEYDLTTKNLKLGGATIYTTIDLTIQQRAEESVNERLRKIEQLPGYRHQTRAQFQASGSSQAPSYMQGALVCIDNKTGGIIASVGGRSADESRFNRAMYARRQIGSLFKPFVFQAAYDRGLRPQTMIDDSALKPGEIDHAGESWSPGNSDGKYLGLIATQEALLRSRNTSSVRVGDYATMSHVQAAGENAGFKLYEYQMQQKGKMPNDATSYLGAWEATPEEVARAYSIFPNLGTYRHPYIISKIVDRNGKTVVNRTKGVQVLETLSKGATYEVSQILEEINISGTGANVRREHGFTAPSAGKTGTTDDYKDAWYAGYTSAVTCAVWVGMDTPKRTISQGYGSRLALPIWADVMAEAARKTEFAPEPLRRELRTTSVEMCNRSSRRANAHCKQQGCAYQDEIPNDLIAKINYPCMIHKMGDQPIAQIAIPTPSDTSSGSQPRSSGGGVSGFFRRLLGQEPAPAPQRAIVVGDDDLPPSVYDEPPARAIVVDDAPQRRAIKVTPNRIPTAPPRAVVVDEPPRTVTPQPAVIQAPPRAIVIDEPAPRPAPAPAPPRAIIIEDPAPPRAIIIDDPAPPKAIPID